MKGAGILIIEKFNNTNVVLLFGKKNIQYEDTGGLIDNNDKSYVMAACRETREETANLFNLDGNIIKKIGHPIQINKYISYAIYVNKININYYYHNIEIVLNKCKYHSWKENNDVVRVDLNKLIYNAHKKISYINDIYNKTVKIRDRTLNIIKKDAIYFLNINKQKPIELNINKILQSEMNCLINTYSYTFTYNFCTNNFFLNNQQNNNKYAICIIPSFNDLLKDIHLCNVMKKIHITLAGFSTKNFIMLNNFINISNSGFKKWTIDINHIKIKNNFVLIKSYTLDKIADILYYLKINKIKGKKYSNHDWHINFSKCSITSDILNILSKSTWKFALVKKNNNSYEWIINENCYVRKII